ncbi:hypothetical protein ZWY2020_027849 [Hordeum vulgare]|nr:hypothetical protein ZWY2020_027849 [Hordeum vulgare]
MPRTYKRARLRHRWGASGIQEGHWASMDDAHQEASLGGGRPGDGHRRRQRLDYLPRAASAPRLGLGNQEVRDAKEAVRKVEDRPDRAPQPESVAAAIIYMVVQQRAGAGRSVKATCP